MTSPSADRATDMPEEPRVGTHGVATPLPLRTEIEPAFQWSVSIVAGPAAGPLARARVRPWLTIGHWEGNVDIAARVADKLVDNAINHGEPFPDGTVILRLIVDAETRELFIEVDDAFRDFPGFADVAVQNGHVEGEPTGLWWVAHYKGYLSWDVKRDDDGHAVGKTVQAVLPVG